MQALLAKVDFDEEKNKTFCLFVRTFEPQFWRIRQDFLKEESEQEEEAVTIHPLKTAQI